MCKINVQTTKHLFYIIFLKWFRTTDFGTTRGNLFLTASDVTHSQTSIDETFVFANVLGAAKVLIVS